MNAPKRLIFLAKLYIIIVSAHTIGEVFSDRQLIYSKRDGETNEGALFAVL